MNRECHGTFYPKARIYRCLYDGAIVDAETKPETCLHCNRPVLAHVSKRKVLLKKETVVSVGLFVPHLKGYDWQEIHRAKGTEGTFTVTKTGEGTLTR